MTGYAPGDAASRAAEAARTPLPDRATLRLLCSSIARRAAAAPDGMGIGVLAVRYTLTFPDMPAYYSTSLFGFETYAG